MAPLIWLADAVRAAERLDAFASEERFALVADVLGVAAATAASSSIEPEPDTGPTPPVSAQPASAPRTSRSSTITKVRRLTPIGTARVPVTGIEGPVLPRSDSPSSRLLPPIRSLLPTRTAGSLLHLLLSQHRHDGDVDIETLVTRMAQGRMTADLPRTRVRTLRYGTRVLVDVGQGMAPFRHDQEQLVRAVRAVAGRHVTVRTFADVPTRRHGRWVFQSPPPHTRVLVLSDFGIGGPPSHVNRATKDEWLEAVASLRRARCFPVALVPYSRVRWPPWLPGLLPAVTWDRTLTVNNVITAGR